MLPRRNSFTAALALGAVLLLHPLAAVAQRHGGHGVGAVSGGPDRPGGVDDKDSLKDFHQALAMQATSQQIAAFQALVKKTDAAKTEMQAFLQEQTDKNPPPDRVASSHHLDKTLDDLRSENKKFVDGFTSVQKSGLKEITRKLERADSDLEQESKRLDQSLLAAGATGSDIKLGVESIDKPLTEFSNQQLAMGREIGIVLANGDDLTFVLASEKVPVTIDKQAISVSVSGGLTQTAVQGEQRMFALEFIADLTDLQQDVTELLRAHIDKAENCGERLSLRRATMASATPSSLLVLQLHYERWTCVRAMGQTSPTELAEGDGEAELSLTPSLEKSNELKVTSEFKRISASGMMADALRSGELGDELRDKVDQVILSAMRPAADFKTTLPPAVRDFAVLKTAKFKDTGAGVFSLVLSGEVQVSNEQVHQMASQLNQTLSAQDVSIK